MAAPSKTADRTLISHQAATHPVTITGTELDVSTLIRLGIVLFHGFVEAAANTNPGVFYIRGNPSASGDDKWADIFSIPVNIGTPDDEVLTAIEPVDATAMAVAATAGFVAEDHLYLQDIDTLADSEWAKCQEIVTNTSIDIVDGLRVEKSTAGSGCKIFNDAFILPIDLDVTVWKRLRIDYLHEGATGANGHILVLASSWDSIA